MNNLSRNLNKFKLVTFDVTDTLLKFRKNPSEHYAKVAADFGYNIKPVLLEQQFRKVFKRKSQEYPNFGRNNKDITWEGWWRELVVEIFINSGNQIPKADLSKIGDQLIEEYKLPHCWTKVDCADDLINKIKNCNKTIGIISNFDPRLHEILENMKLPKFDFVFTSYERNKLKPNPAIFQDALDRCYVKNNEALHIGNTFATDYIGAQNAGWSCIHIANGSYDWQNCPDVRHEHAFSNLRDLLNTLEQEKIVW